MSEGRIGILSPVWHGYRWIAPLLQRGLARHWPDHPPLWFCGLRPEEASGLPALPSDPALDRTNWSAMVLEGALALRDRGFDYIYLIAEEHLPLEACHERHLNETLPGLMRSLPAVYISLMGWDNRRFTSRSPVLPASRHRLMHLNAPSDARFHLHPALWRLDALIACCELALHDPARNGSAWHFEKVNDRETGHHPPEWKQQCYQISAAALSARPQTRSRRFARAAEMAVYHKLMALYPLIPHRALAQRYARAVAFDDFLCDGPYPMFFSGIMAKGRINDYLERYLGRTPEGQALLAEIRAAQP